MDDMNQQLKSIFSKNIYNLDRYTVNLMITKLECLGNYYSEIASALRTLFPVRRLHPWVFVLTYEDLMRRFLLDSLYQVLYGLGHIDLIRSDLREVTGYTSVKRFNVPKHLITMYRRFKLKKGKFPVPPRNWNIDL